MDPNPNLLSSVVRHLVAPIAAVALLAAATSAHSQFTNGAAAQFSYIDSFGRTKYLSLSPESLRAINNRIYFSGNTSTGGIAYHEPFYTDGTPATSVFLKDIYVGATIASDPAEFTKVGDQVYFSARDGTNGRELWKTDGTPAGTVLVSNIYPGPTSSSPNNLVECQGKLLFSANDGVHGEEWWVSDGTVSGTQMLREIASGSSSSTTYNPFNWNGVVYFAAKEGTNNVDFWRSDGTDAGTYKLVDMNITASGTYPKNFTVSNGQLFFSANTPAYSGASELWKTDGTAGGTVLVKNITGSAYPAGRLTDVNGTLYFVDDILSDQYGNEIWRSDGTTAGTSMVKAIGGGSGSAPRYLTNYNGTLYFSADDGVHDRQIWKTDGTPAGTVMVHEVYNAVGNNPPNPQDLAVLGNKLVFRMTRDGYGREWWYTDGTPAGPTLIANIETGVLVSTSDEFVVAGNSLYYPVYNGATSASELWRISLYVPPVKSQMLTPADGSTLASTTQTFTWDSGTGVSSYALWIGSAPGGYDIYSGNEGVNLNKTVTTLPDDGRTLYVSLFSLINGSYQGNAYTYTAFKGPQPRKARITSPAPGSTLGSASLPLVWDAGLNVTSYFLFVGTTAGGNNLYAGDQGTATSRTVPVAAGMGRVYVTLYSLIKGAYQANYYYFDSQPAVKAALTSPTNGATLASGSSLNLAWSAGTGVTSYAVWLGSSYGGYDLGAAATGTTASASLPIVQDGGPVYVTLWSLINGAYQSNSYWFTTALPASGNRPARLTSHANTSTLSSTAMNLTWDAGVGASSYALWVGSKPDGYDLYAGNEGSATSRTVTVPGDGRRIYVTLHTLIGGSYQSSSYYFTCATLPGGGAAQMTSPANGSTLASTSLALNWNTAPGASQYYLWAGSSPNSSDIYAGNEGANTMKTVTVNTNGCPVYVTLWSLINGQWLSNSYYYKRADIGGGNRPAWITSPSNGGTLASASNTFTWDGGVGVTNCALWIGSSSGAYDLLAAAVSANSNRTVTLPTDGRKVYVTLWSLIGGVYQSASYQYTTASIAPAAAALTSPTPGSTLPGKTATFTWSTGTGATAYVLWIGRTPGGYDVYAGAEGANTSRTVTTLPTDGGPVYVTLYSWINGAWQHSDAMLNAADP